MPQPAPSGPAPNCTLFSLLVALLAPLFLNAAAGDLTLARAAAAETIRSFRADTHSDLIAVAQIIAFAIAALASLSQSMDPDVPLPLALRLRAQANTSNRWSEKARLARPLQTSSGQPSQPPASSHQADPAELIAEIAATEKRTADHLAGFADRAEQPDYTHAAWAAGAARVAAETAAGLAALPPAQRRNDAVWAEILNECAKDLITSPLRPRPGSNHPIQLDP
jgi:hypothetical protein